MLQLRLASEASLLHVPTQSGYVGQQMWTFCNWVTAPILLIRNPAPQKVEFDGSFLLLLLYFLGILSLFGFARDFIYVSARLFVRPFAVNVPTLSS